MLTDAKIHRAIFDELRWDPSVRDAEIGVAVKDGVATLSGQVNTFAQKFAADRAAERVAGVRAIADEIKVRLAASDERSDTDIAHAAAVARLDDKRSARSLRGTVRSCAERKEAERAAWSAPGVTEVEDRIQIAV